MSQNIDALRLNERRSLAYMVNDFLEDSDAVLAVKENRAISWRVRWLAEQAFIDSVRERKECGCLLYLHDGCALVKKGGAA